MLFARDFRSIARQALANHWGVAVGTGFVAGLLGVSGSTNIPRMEFREYQEVLNSEYGSFVFAILMVVLSVAIVWALICFILGGPITLGYARFNKNLISGQEARFQDLFSRFDMFGKGFLMQLLIGIYVFLWTLLFIIPGIIAAFSYAMTPYILEENPQMTANEAIYYSKEMMRGNKWRLFCLNISFIGWSILCLFTCGIGYLWLAPYISAAQAAFYFEVSGKFNNQNHQQYDQRYNQRYQQYNQGNSGQYNQWNQQ